MNFLDVFDPFCDPSFAEAAITSEKDKITIIRTLFSRQNSKRPLFVLLFGSISNPE